MRGDPKYVIITVGHRRVRGELRRVYHVRLCPLETSRFRFGLPIGGTTTSRELAEKYAARVEEYVRYFLESEIALRARAKRRKSLR